LLFKGDPLNSSTASPPFPFSSFPRPLPPPPPPRPQESIFCSLSVSPSVADVQACLAASLRALRAGSLQPILHQNNTTTVLFSAALENDVKIAIIARECLKAARNLSTRDPAVLPQLMQSLSASPPPSLPPSLPLSLSPSLRMSLHHYSCRSPQRRRSGSSKRWRRSESERSEETCFTSSPVIPAMATQLIAANDIATIFQLQHFVDSQIPLPDQVRVSHSHHDMLERFPLLSLPPHLTTCLSHFCSHHLDRPS
jgi:hypothetical protein